jgi:hypothetical protein
MRRPAPSLGEQKKHISVILQCVAGRPRPTLVRPDLIGCVELSSPSACLRPGRCRPRSYVQLVLRPCMDRPVRTTDASTANLSDAARHMYMARCRLHGRTVLEASQGSRPLIAGAGKPHQHSPFFFARSIPSPRDAPGSSSPPSSFTAVRWRSTHRLRWSGTRCSIAVSCAFFRSLTSLPDC